MEKKGNMEGKQSKSERFSARKAGLRDILLREHTEFERKKKEKRRTIIAKILNYKQCEKVLNKYKVLKLWEDQIYINEDISEYTAEKRRILFKRAKEIRERGKFAKVA